jgi:hypothetical protein
MQVNLWQHIAPKGSSLGGTTPAIFTVLSPTQIRATAPALSIGTVDVRVVNTRGTSLIRPAARFTYVLGTPPPPSPAPPSAPGFGPGPNSAEPDGSPDEGSAVIALLLSGEDDGPFPSGSAVDAPAGFVQPIAIPPLDPLAPSNVDEVMALSSGSGPSRKDARFGLAEFTRKSPVVVPFAVLENVPGLGHLDEVQDETR